MAGRPRKPLKIHKLDGTFRQDRHARPSVAKDTANGAPPLADGLDELGESMWQHVVSTRSDWLAQSDGPALRTLCETWSLKCRALASVTRMPTDKDARIAYVSYLQECNKLFAKFGLTPTDRAKLGEQTASELDPAAEFIA